MKDSDYKSLKASIDLVLSNQMFIIARLDEVVNLASIAILHQLPQQAHQQQPKQESKP